MQDRAMAERWAMACCEGGFPQTITSQGPDGNWSATPAPRSWDQVRIAWKAHQLVQSEDAWMSWDEYRAKIALNWWACTLVESVNA